MKPIAALIIGNEILAGRRHDVHLNNTIAACNARGLRLAQALILGDDRQALVRAYRSLRAKNHIILSYGGIGATPDDRTRQAVAEACGIPLRSHPEGIAILEDKFGDELTDNRRRLVEFPQGARLIPNPVNRVPGFSCDDIHCVPGFPQMAQPMIEWVLDTYYLDYARPLHYRALMVEAPESEISPLMQHLETRYPTLAVSSLPKIAHALELGVEGEEAAVTQAVAEARQWLDEHRIRYTPHL